MEARSRSELESTALLAAAEYGGPRACYQCGPVNRHQPAHASCPE